MLLIFIFFSLFSHLCLVHMCVHVCTRVGTCMGWGWVCICVHACMWSPKSSLISLLPSSLGQDLSIKPRIHWYGQSHSHAFSVDWFHIPKLELQAGHHTHPSFYLHSGNTAIVLKIVQPGLQSLNHLPCPTSCFTLDLIHLFSISSL